MAKSKGILLTNDMELDISIVRDSNGLIVSGLQIGDVTQQNQKIIINASKGEIKEDPLCGVSAQLFVESEDKSAFAREIRGQLQRDGQTVKSITVKAHEIRVEATY